MHHRGITSNRKMPPGRMEFFIDAARVRKVLAGLNGQRVSSHDDSIDAAQQVVVPPDDESQSPPPCNLAAPNVGPEVRRKIEPMTSEAPAATPKKNGRKKQTQQTVEKRADSGLDAEIQELNDEHFIVNIGGKVCIANIDPDPHTGRDVLSLSSSADFRLRYQNRMTPENKSIAVIWLASPNRRQYRGLTFDPSGTPEGYFNLFTGFPVEPIKGDCGLYWEHVYSNICSGNVDHYWYVRRWMAHSIQRPDELPGTAVVLRGQQGTGKGVFVDNYGQLFGEHYVTLYRLDQMTGRFNAHIKNVMVLHANEATCRGDKVGEGVLKGLITDTKVPIEYKGKDIITIDNYKRIIVATNEDWAVPMGMDDRRFLVLEVSSAKKENKIYFAAIIEQMANGGQEALMYDLLHEDLTGFDVRTVPFSASNFEQKLHSAPAIVNWWFEKLSDGCLTPGEFSQSASKWTIMPSHDQLHGDFAQWCRDARTHSMSKALFGRALRKLLPGLTLGEARCNQTVIDTNGKVRIRYYLLPSLQECRQAFQRYSKCGPEIWPEDN